MTIDFVLSSRATRSLVARTRSSFLTMSLVAAHAWCSYTLLNMLLLRQWPPGGELERRVFGTPATLSLCKGASHTSYHFDGLWWSVLVMFLSGTQPSSRPSARCELRCLCGPMAPWGWRALRYQPRCRCTKVHQTFPTTVMTDGGLSSSNEVQCLCTVTTPRSVCARHTIATMCKRSWPWPAHALCNAGRTFEQHKPGAC